MHTLGHGIDLVEIPRIADMLAAHGSRFLDRCFTSDEQAYAARNESRRAEHLAGRFAAKEAVLKALGTGWSGGIAWTDVEVVRQPTGQPTVRLHNICAQLAEDRGITDWLLSITHVRSHAMASAIALGPKAQ
jgi:holo-[acyl-carrier protein] synthase